MFKKLFLSILIILFPLFVFAQEIDEQGAFLMAKDAYDKQDYSVSLDLFNRFIEKFPQSRAMSEAQLYIGQCLFQKDKFIESRDVLTKLEKSYVPYGIEDRLLFWLGQVYLKVKDFKQAGEYFRKMIEMHPNSNLLSSAKTQLGWILFQDGRYEEAKDIFEELTKSEDLAIREEALFKKGETLLYMKDYKGVLDNYRIFVEVFLDSDKLARAYFYMGEANFYSDNFNKAIECYTNALKGSDDDLIKIMSLQAIGWSYLKENKLKEAQEAFSKIDKFENKVFKKENLYFGKATLYFQLNKLDDALIYYDKLINMYPQSDMLIQALFGKAECLNGLFRFEEAIGVYKEVIERGAQEDVGEISDIIDKAHYNLGRLYIKIEDFKSALEELQDLISSTSNKELKLSALSVTGDIYQNNQEFDKAIEVYSRILKDYPDNPYNDYIQYQIGLIQLKADKIDSAILSFRNFNINFIQSDLLGDANYYLGYAYFKNNKLEDACQQLQKFLEAFKDSVYRDRATYLLAVAFYNRGMFNEAIEKFEAILKEFRQNKDLIEKAEYEIANALYQMGEEGLAVKKFEQFINAHSKSEIAPNVIFWLGQYYYGTSQYELARKKFETVIRMYPKYDLAQEARYEMGLTFLAEERYNESIQVFERLLEICNQQELKAKTMLATADLLLEQGKQGQAIEMYNELTKLINLNNVDSTVQMEIEKGNRGKFNTETIEYSEEKIKAKNTDIKVDEIKGEESLNGSVIQFVKLAYIRLGDLYKKDRKFSEAIYAFRQALSFPLNEYNAQIQFRIAECLEEEYNLDASIEVYLNIPYNYEEDKPWVVKGLLRSARIYEDKEDWQSAIKIYERVLNYDVAEAKFAKEKIELIKQRMR